MELHFVSVYRLHGISKLPEEEPCRVWQAKDANAYLTGKLESFVEHADRSLAVIHGLMTGLFGDQQPGTVEERMDARVTALREERARKHSNAVFLVFHATREAGPLLADIKRDTENFSVAFDAIDKKAVFNEYLPALLRALTSVVVGLDLEATARLSKVTQASYLIDASSGKPTYSVTFEAGAATVSLAKIPDATVLESIARNASALKSDAKITRVLNQFVQSLTGDFDEFRSFLSAWNGLEIFVSSSFKQKYAERWFAVLLAAVPLSAAEYFDRLREIMSDRHRLADKFVVIASLLNEAGAEADIALFKKLKARRDDVSHGTDDPSTPYPILETQQLLRKYLRLHMGE